MKKKSIALILCALLIGLILCGVAFASAVQQQTTADFTADTLRLSNSYGIGKTEGTGMVFPSDSDYQAFLAKETLKDTKSATCLQCHGPTLANLTAKTKNYTDAWGEKVNPHMYVDIAKTNPHQSEMVPSCLECHTAHALPKPTAKMAKATLDYCYSCHHTQEFQKCSACHNQ